MGGVRTATEANLLIHGDRDATVGLNHTQRLRVRLEQLGVPTTVRIYRDTNHTRVIGSLASSLRFPNPAFRGIERFLHKTELDLACRHGVNDDA